MGVDGEDQFLVGQTNTLPNQERRLLDSKNFPIQSPIEQDSG